MFNNKNQMESNIITPTVGLALEESTTERVPNLLEELVKKAPPQNNTDSMQKDYLFIVILVSMIENEFVLLDEDFKPIEYSEIDVNQFSKWKNNSGDYEALFVLSEFQNTFIRLIVSPLGAMVLVNVVICDLNSETYSVCLPVSRYVVSPKAPTIPMIFRDLKHLSHTLKNKVLAPVKSRILSYHGFASASLIGLPEEVLTKILLNMKIKDVLNVSETCTALNMVIQSDTLWHDLVKYDFKQEEYACHSEISTWREIYKIMYITKHNQSRRRLPLQVAGSLHDHMDYSDYVSYIDNPMWNVIM